MVSDTNNFCKKEKKKKDSTQYSFVLDMDGPRNLERSLPPTDINQNSPHSTKTYRYRQHRNSSRFANTNCRFKPGKVKYGIPKIK